MPLFQDCFKILSIGGAILRTSYSLAALLFNHVVDLNCVSLYIFGFQHKQYANSYKELTFFPTFILVIFILFISFFLYHVTQCCEKIRRNLLRIKSVSSKAAFYKRLTTYSVSMSLRWFSKSSLNVPKSPATKDLTIASALVVTYPGTFWSPGTTMPMIVYSLFSLSITRMTAFQCSISMPV